MTNLTPATNLNALTHEELMDEWFWLVDQPQTKKTTNALDKCWQEICDREERREELRASLG